MKLLGAGHDLFEDLGGDPGEFEAAAGLAEAGVDGAPDAGGDFGLDVLFLSVSGLVEAGFAFGVLPGLGVGFVFGVLAAGDGFAGVVLLNGADLVDDLHADAAVGGGGAVAVGAGDFIDDELLHGAAGEDSGAC